VQRSRVKEEVREIRHAFLLFWISATPEINNSANDSELQIDKIRGIEPNRTIGYGYHIFLILGTSPVGKSKK
jgi:hypothetical protein